MVNMEWKTMFLHQSSVSCRIVHIDLWLCEILVPTQSMNDITLMDSQIQVKCNLHSVTPSPFRMDYRTVILILKFKHTFYLLKFNRYV